MKKRLNILVAMFVSAAVVAISVMGIVSEFFNPHIWYKVNSNNLAGHYKREYFKLVESTEVLNEIFDISYSDSYDDSFFRDKVLIVLIFNEANSNPSYSVEDVFIENDMLNVNLIKHYALQGFQSNWHWEILIEVKKSDIKYIAGIKKTITEVEIEEYD